MLELSRQVPFSVFEITGDTEPFIEGGRISSAEQCGCYLCCQGSAELETPSESIHISKGNLFFYTPSSLIKICSVSKDLKGYVAVFDSATIVDTLRRVVEVPGLLQLRIHPLVYLNDTEYQNVFKLLSEVKQSLATVSNDSDTMSRIHNEIVKARCVAVTFEIMRIYFSKIPVDYRLGKARQAMAFEEFLISAHRNFRTCHTIDFYAQQAKLSLKYFSSMVRKVSGYTPGAIIDHLLISEAKKMLLNRKLSIKEIATELNFSSQSSFGKFFKRHAGMSPDRFRMSN